MKRQTRIAFATFAAAGIVATASYAPAPQPANDNGAQPSVQATLEQDGPDDEPA